MVFKLLLYVKHILFCVPLGRFQSNAANFFVIVTFTTGVRERWNWNLEVSRLAKAFF